MGCIVLLKFGAVVVDLHKYSSAQCKCFSQISKKDLMGSSLRDC